LLLHRIGVAATTQRYRLGLNSPFWDIPSSVGFLQVPKSNFSNEYAIFREMLKRLRSERCVTQSDLSASLGMAQSFVSKYEMGERRLDFVEVSRICAELGKPLTEFAAEYAEATSSKRAKTKGGSKS